MTNPLITEAEEACAILRDEFPNQSFTVKAFSPDNVKIFGNKNTVAEWAVCVVSGRALKSARDTATFIERCVR
jgi:hypothetical protein